MTDPTTDTEAPEVRTTDVPATQVDPSTAGSAPDPELEPDPRLKDPDATDAA